MSRDIEAVPAVMITTPNDPSAVILRTGAAAIGMTIAQARFVSQQMARAADDAEFRIDQYKRLRDEHVGTPRDGAAFFETEQCPSDRYFGR